MAVLFLWDLILQGSHVHHMSLGCPWTKSRCFRRRDTGRGFLIFLQDLAKHRMISTFGDVLRLPSVIIEDVAAMLGYVWWSVHWT